MKNYFWQHVNNWAVYLLFLVGPLAIIAMIVSSDAFIPGSGNTGLIFVSQQGQILGQANKLAGAKDSEIIFLLLAASMYLLGVILYIVSGWQLKINNISFKTKYASVFLGFPLQSIYFPGFIAFLVGFFLREFTLFLIPIWWIVTWKLADPQRKDKILETKLMKLFRDSNPAKRLSGLKSAMTISDPSQTFVDEIYAMTNDDDSEVKISALDLYNRYQQSKSPK